MAARRRTAATLVAAALAVALGGCGSDSDEPLDSASVQDLTADPSGSFDLDEAEAGQRISLRVKVAQVLSPDSFVVPPEQTAGPPLLVLARDHGASPGDVLQVGGLLRVFSYDDQSGDYELAPQGQYGEFASKVALLATLNDDDLPLDDQ